MRKTSPTVLRYLGALYGGGALAGDSDSQLLEQLTATTGDADRTTAELAFATLLERHGAMVWRVCRSVVLDEHDAEDAFQATFLVLIRKAGSLRVRQTLGPWLFAVANRVGMSARAASRRRRTIERAAGARALGKNDARSRGRSSETEELGALLHEEVVRLPERFRAAVVLCDLEGMSYEQAAARLDVPLGTLQSRLDRARKRLRDQLIRRGIGGFDGVDGPESTCVFLAGRVGRITPSRALEQTTCRQCLSLVTDPAGLHTIVSGSVKHLIEKGSNSMIFAKWNAAALVPIAAMILCGGILFNNQTMAERRQEKDRPSKQPSDVLKSGARVTHVPDISFPITPAPLELKVANGSGKARVYALDSVGRRIPDHVGDPGGSNLEVNLDIRWVVVTGVVNHTAIEKSFAHGDDLAVLPAERIYRRVELDRQSQQRGSWSRWQVVDTEKTYRILDNLPERVLERVDDEFRVDNLVDPVPVLVEGVWNDLDVERLVPHLTGGKLVDPLFEIGKQRKHDRARPPILMLRAFDFTVEPGKTYRYRARLVIWTPLEIHRKMKRKRPDFPGPWSEPTDGIEVR